MYGRRIFCINLWAWDAAYATWREQNKEKRIQRLGVVGFQSQSIDDLCSKDQMSILQSSYQLLAQRNSQETSKQPRHPLIQDAPQKTSTIAKGGAIIGALVVALGMGIYFLFKNSGITQSSVATQRLKIG